MSKPRTLFAVCSSVALVWASVVIGSAARADSAPKRPHFTDVAPHSKFSYFTNNDYRGTKYFPQPMCGGVAAFDYDNDGKVDLFFTNGAKFPELRKSDASFYNCLLRNKGDGTFDDVTSASGLAGANLGSSFGVAAGDYDNDGYVDLFVANSGRNALYHNNGDGTFTDVTEKSGIGGKPKDTLSLAAAWFDYDNDGLLDLVVANYTVWTPEKDVRCKQNERQGYCNPQIYPSVPQRLYHNLGGGKFEDVTERSGFGAALGKGMGIGIADFNRDGYMDVFIANDTVRNFLYLNQKNGTFKEDGFNYGVAYDEAGTTVSAMGADVKDYDNDGWVDIFYNNLMGQIWALFHNNHGTSFDYASESSEIARRSASFSGWSAGFIDYDNDGWKDLYSANGDVDDTAANARQHDSMFRNEGGKKFADVSDQMGADFMSVGFQRGSAFADLNNDGFLDLVVTSLGKPPRIMLNSGDNGNHWLLLDLVGHKSNRDAIGAVVKVTTESGRTFYNHVTTSVGFMSSSDKRVHFGLAGETGIKSVEIRWPSSTVQTLKDVSADRIIKIDESTPTSGRASK